MYKFATKDVRFTAKYPTPYTHKLSYVYILCSTDFVIVTIFSKAHSNDETIEFYKKKKKINNEWDSLILQLFYSFYLLFWKLNVTQKNGGTEIWL